MGITNNRKQPRMSEITDKLKELGEKWANLPSGTEANEIADEVMDKLPEVLQEMQQLEKACAEMREALEGAKCNCAGLRIYGNPDFVCSRCHALSTSCGSSYIHRDEVKPLVEALQGAKCNCDGLRMYGNPQFICARCQALAHAEKLKGEKE
jgi:hypothetical protein